MCVTVIVLGTANWSILCNSINKHISRCNGYTSSYASNEGSKKIFCVGDDNKTKKQ